MLPIYRLTINLTILIAGLFITFSSEPVYSDGFPVVDVASIAEQIKLFEQTMKEYEQMMVEYEHYLNQLASLQETIPDLNWEQLATNSIGYYGSGKTSNLPSLNIQDPQYNTKLDSILSHYGQLAEKGDTAKNKWQEVGINIDKNHPLYISAERQFDNFARQRDIYSQAAFNQEQSTKRQDAIKTHQQILQQLGGESDLATMQFMASQNQLMMDQLESLNLSLNQLLITQESNYAAQAQAAAEASNHEIKRLAKEINTPAEQSGKERWGNM